MKCELLGIFIQAVTMFFCSQANIFLKKNSKNKFIKFNTRVYYKKL